jgi:hypothetical protein
LSSSAPVGATVIIVAGPAVAAGLLLSAVIGRGCLSGRYWPVLSWPGTEETLTDGRKALLIE